MTATECPECRQPIPTGAPEGQCPACLLKRGLENAMFASPAYAETTPQGTKQKPLTAEMIASCFPQMDVLELLGQGGMGTVFKAKQKKLDRLVAVKLIRPESADDPAFAERFMGEARTLARLSHPGIVGVHDFGEIRLPASDNNSSGGLVFYFIMEFVDGANLRQLMQSGQLSPELALNVVRQICDALQYAHDEGVVHRDIKPENILLDTRGRVKIADFGLAKIADRAVDEWTLTGTHQVMGTPRYMAPEQLAGSRNVDHRADIYSLAVVFYEMLTGSIPIGHFAPPSKKSPVDVRLDDVILKAMASEPEQRFQSARDLKGSVDSISSIRSTASGPSSPGLSTIIDRQVAGAWQLLTGRNGGQTQKRRGIPALLFLLLAVAGLVFVLLARVMLRDPASLPSSESGILGLSAGLFGLIAVLWLIVPETLRRTAWPMGGTLLLTIALLIALGTGVADVPRELQLCYFWAMFFAAILGCLSVAGLRSAFGSAEHMQPSDSRADNVIVTQDELSAGILPDVCMICGAPATCRDFSSIEYKPKWAEATKLGGNVMGGVPGGIIHMMTPRKVHVSCPTCENHRGHWHHRNVFASVGWMLIVVLAGLGLAIGALRFNFNGEETTTLTLGLGLVGLVAYLVPVIWMSWNVVKLEPISDQLSPSTRIGMQRVSTAFASEVRRRQASAAKKA